MKKFSNVFPVIFPCLILMLPVTISCNPRKPEPTPLSNARIGMNYIEVVEQVGIPDTIIHLGTMLDEFGSQTKTDEWWYGNNRVIVMVNDTVNAIDLDATATQKRIREIIDSALAEDGG